MIIDTLSVVGIASIAFYLVSFFWFGRETLRVDEGACTRGETPVQPTEVPCPEC